MLVARRRPGAPSHRKLAFSFCWSPSFSGSCNYSAAAARAAGGGRGPRRRHTGLITDVSTRVGWLLRGASAGAPAGALAIAARCDWRHNLALSCTSLLRGRDKPAQVPRSGAGWVRAAEVASRRHQLREHVRGCTAQVQCSIGKLAIMLRTRTAQHVNGLQGLTRVGDICQSSTAYKMTQPVHLSRPKEGHG